MFATYIFGPPRMYGMKAKTVLASASVEVAQYCHQLRLPDLSLKVLIQAIVALGISLEHDDELEIFVMLLVRLGSDGAACHVLNRGCSTEGDTF